MRPLILVSNDDGIESPYLHALADALEADAGAEGPEVLVVAPERERSAVSHSITLHKPLRAVERQPRRYSLSGSPVDCVYVGVLKLSPRRPALVVSGINRGFNLGSDVFYSGTVAAAAEGALRGVPAIALSLEPRSEVDLDAATGFAAGLVRAVLSSHMPPRTLLNVNLPARPDGRYRWTRLGERFYEDVVEERSDPRGKPYYWIGGGVVDMSDEPGSDTEAVHQGVISVSPLHLDLTAHDLLLDEPLWHVDGYELVPTPLPPEDRS
jgi:5'-nucleotidase